MSNLQPVLDGSCHERRINKDELMLSCNIHLCLFNENIGEGTANTAL